MGDDVGAKEKAVGRQEEQDGTGRRRCKKFDTEER